MGGVSVVFSVLLISLKAQVKDLLLAFFHWYCTSNRSSNGLLSKDENSPEDEDTCGHGKNSKTKHHLSFSPFHLSLRWNSVWPRINYFYYSFRRHIHISENETVVHSQMNITGIGGWIAILVSESLMTAQWRMHDFPDKGARTPRMGANHLKNFFYHNLHENEFDQGTRPWCSPIRQC